MTMLKKIKAQLIRKTNGGYEVSLPGMLVLSAAAAYNTDGEVTADGRALGLRTVNGLLSAATKAGFTKSEVLETLLARGEVSSRVRDLTIECLDAVGQERAIEIIREASKT
jgi:hypothetical protein